MTEKTTKPDLEAEPIVDPSPPDLEAEPIVDPSPPDLEAEPIVDPSPPDLEAEPIVDPSPPIHGRALVDIHRLGLSCGQYGTVPAEEVAALVAAGEFDPSA